MKSEAYFFFVKPSQLSFNQFSSFRIVLQIVHEEIGDLFFFILEKAVNCNLNQPFSLKRVLNIILNEPVNCQINQFNSLRIVLHIILEEIGGFFFILEKVVYCNLNQLFSLRRVLEIILNEI